MKRIIFFMLIVLLSCNATTLWGQATLQGKEYYLAFGNNLNTAYNGVDLEIRIVATNEANVKITFTETGETVNIVVPEGTVKTHVLTTAQKLASYNPLTQKSKKSIHITSDEYISVFALNQRSVSTDATNVIPVNGLGTDYYHLSYLALNVSGAGPGDGYTIIGTEDGTTIKRNGANLTTLNKGEVYSFYQVTDLTGTHITSDNAIAYFTTNSCVNIPDGKAACDCLFQQMASTSVWGNTFLVPVTTQGVERIRVLASQNGTVITHQGGTVIEDIGQNSLSLNAGEFVELEVRAADKGSYITANKPVAVASYLTGKDYVTTGLGDPSLAWVPPIEQVVDNVAIAPFIPAGTTALTVHYALLVTKTSGKNNTKMRIGTGVEGNLSGGTWVDHPSGYSFYSLQMTQTDKTYFFANADGLTMMGYGLGGYESYYYLAASSSRKLNAFFNIDDKHYEDYDGKEFCELAAPFAIKGVVQYPLSSSPGHIRWFIDGVENTAARDKLTWTLNSITQNAPVKITMRVTNNINEVEDLSTTFTVSVNPTPTISPSGTQLIFPGSHVTLTSSEPSGNQWYLDGKEIVGATSTTYNASEEGIYTVKTIAGCTSEASLPVMVLHYPDNIAEVDCWIDPLKTNWKPVLKARSDSKVHILAQPFVGDIDGDGKLEVVTTNVDNTADSGYAYSNSILIFDNELKLKETIPTPLMCSRTVTPLVLLRLPGEPQALIVVACDDNDKNMYNQKLKAYRPDGAVAWTSSHIIFNDSTPNFHRQVSISLVVGDIDNDGTPEILAGDRIFCAKTGVLLGSLPGYLTDPKNGRGARSLNSTAGWNNTGNFTTMPVLADIDNDGKLEVIGGNTTYKVTINSRTDHTQNKVEVLARAKGINYDGFVSVADIDLDGQLDVVSITNSINGKPSLVVWNGVTGDIIAGPVSPSFAAGGGSRVFIGDVDFDTDPSGHPELFFSYASNLVGFKYDPAKPVANRLMEMWRKPTSDTSGATTLSMFDFDQSGSPKLVYRDESRLRIIDATTGENMKEIPCFSATHSEYPIVVDFDQNGHADILVSGSEGGQTGTDVRLYWFSGEDDDWAPARTVWNQHGYNSVHVNEDLTIPRFQLNPSTIFPGKPGKPVRPYNGFLLQQTALSRDGMPLFPAPNVQIEGANTIAYSYDNVTDKLIISNLKLTNKGDATLNGPIMISVYDKEVKAENLIITHLEPQSIAKGGTITVTIEVLNFGQYIHGNNLVISINDDGTGNTKESVCEECEPNETSTFTNIDISGLAWADPYKNCIGNTVQFDAKDFSATGANVKYQWLYPNASPLQAIRNPQIMNLQLSHAGRYTVVIEGINDDLSIRYTLPHLSVAPPTMYWSGKEDSNWNNIENWASDIDGTPLNPKAIPVSCTSVHIPYLSGAGANYPSLHTDVTPQDTAQGKTGIYGKPEVDNITFHYGSELAYPHQLTYNRAKVQYNFGYYNTFTHGTQPTANKDGSSVLSMKRDRWYALAAPLKNMATGDFVFGGYPYTWQALNDIISGNEVTFESKNMTNDINLAKTNNAIVIKSGLYNTGIGYDNHKHVQSLDGILEIPYLDNKSESDYHPGHSYDLFTGYSTFYYFNAKTLQTMYNPVGKMKRGEESYRFVFENDSHKIDSIMLKGENVACYVMKVDAPAGKHILIGNPFISSINMDRFFEVNKDVLEENEGYRLYVDNSGLEWKKYNYKMTDGTYNAVNSLQSFIVCLKSTGANQDIYFPLEGAYALTGTVTNAMPRRLELPGALNVSVKTSQGMEGDYAELSPASQNELTDNVSKLISKEDSETPEVFLIGRNNTGYNLMQVYDSEDYEVRLGVRYSNVSNDLTLTFSQINEFASLTGTTPILIDKATNVKQNLSENDSYTFRQTAVNAGSNYTDSDRFVIHFTEANGIFSQEDELTINYADKLLTVNASLGIQKVEIYNLSGQQVFSSLLDEPSAHYSQSVDLPFSVYIVRVTKTDNKIVNRKLIVQ